MLLYVKNSLHEDIYFSILFRFF